MIFPHGRLAVWYFWYFAFIGAFLPYFALYLQSIGLSAGRIAVLMSLGQLMRLLAPLLWSWLADSGGRRVRIVVASTAAALASFSVVFLTQDFVGLLIGLAVLHFFWSASLPLVEALKIPLLSAEEQSFVDELQPYALAESDILQALETHGLEGAMEIRDYVLAEIGRRQGTLEEIRNTGAYLARCFREGYGRKTAEERTAARRQRTAKAIAQSQQQAKEQQRAAIDALITRFRQQQAAQVEARLAAMTDQEREAFDQAFIRTHPVWAKSYRTAGLTSPMLRAALQTFAIPRLLTAEQQDLTGYARAQGASLEILNLLQLSA